MKGLRAACYRGSKRALDIGVAVVVLVIGALPAALIAFAIKLNDREAPILFRQRRCGAGGHSFTLYKFRTMVPDAEALKDSLRSRSSMSWPDFSLEDDPRVTRIGRMLRKTSLDELPQLLNVLRGDMSLVGPRPTSFTASTYELWQTERLYFRPGLTGPWQVWGRGTMSFPERCRLEISFFRSPSLLREMQVLALTLPALFARGGAA